MARWHFLIILGSMSLNSGVAQTINTANYVYLYAFNKLLKLDHPKVIDIFIGSFMTYHPFCLTSYLNKLIHLEQALEAHRGQGKDIFYRDSYTCPTEAKYEMIVIQSKIIKHDF